MLSLATITTTQNKLNSGCLLCDGFTDTNLGELQKQPASLGEVASQSVELKSFTTVLPTFLKLQNFVTKEPNFHSNELLIKKVNKHLENHGINGFFDTEGFTKLMNILTNHDLSALCKLYSFQRYSNVIDVMCLSFYDIVFVIEDGLGMTPKYIDDCVSIIANVMFSTLLYDNTGVYIRTLNTTKAADELKSVVEIETFIKSLNQHNQSKSLGEEMYDKVYETVVKPTVNELTKPVLLVVLSNSVPTEKEEVLESLQRCRNESDHKMFLTFVNVTGSADVAKYYKELENNPNVTLVNLLTNIGSLVK